MAAKSTERFVKRRMRGFEKADGLLSSHVRKASEGRGFAVSRLVTHWSEVAGEEIAKVTRPIRVNYGRGGLGATLVLLVRGAMGPMIQAELPRLRDRVNAVYGYAAVSKIQLTQTAPTGFAEGQAEFQPKKAPKVPLEPDEKSQVAGQRAAADVQDPELRLALSRMGAHILKPNTDSEKA